MKRLSPSLLMTKPHPPLAEGGALSSYVSEGLKSALIERSR